MSTTRQAGQARAERKVICPLTDTQLALVEANVPLAKWTAGKIGLPPWIVGVADWDDVFGWCCEGLALAAITYDASHGAAFSTWAALKMRRYVQDMFRKLDPIPRHYRDELRKVDQAREFLASTQQAEEALQLAELLGISVGRLRDIETTRRRSVSFETLARWRSDEDPTPWADVFADEHAIDPAAAVTDREAVLAIRDDIAALPERERYIVRRRIQRASMAAIAGELGLSESRIGQLNRRAQGMLHHASEAAV
jgi:RNA polymerase sigma factor (sigma-70 family)